MMEFTVGTMIPLEFGGELEIIDVLGDGGQGTVYKALYSNPSLKVNTMNV